MTLSDTFSDPLTQEFVQITNHPQDNQANPFTRSFCAS
jgi:hypothetical protein